MKLRAIQLFVVAVTVLGFIGYANSMTYLLGLLGHSSVPYANLEYTLLFTNQESSEITIKVMGVENKTLKNVQDVVVVVDGKDTINLDQKHGLNQSEIANKSLIVRSDPVNAKYTLQVFLKRTDNDYTEGFMAIPFEHLLGTSLSEANRAYEYIVTTFCATSGFCQLAIAAGDKKANVKITYPNKMEEVTFCYGANGDYLYKSSTDSDSVIFLKPWHAVQIETMSDLTGTHIYSLEPITVFAGSHNVSNDDVTAHTVEQLPTSSHWGREYVVTNLGETGYGDIIKIASNWENNEITMKGFPSFKLSSSSHVVTKRLGKGMTSYIKAKNPIQVVQISGLPYASNETSTLAMTVVSAIKHRQNNYTVSCDEEGTATFTLFRNFSDATIQLNSADLTTTHALVTYTGYEILMFDETAEKYPLTSSLPFSGIVKCGNAIMPLGTYITYPETATAPPSTDGTGTGGTCKEGLIGYSSRSPTGKPNEYQQSAHRITLGGTDDIVKLRAKFCGPLVVQFYENMDYLTDSVMISLSKGNISLIECYDGSCNKTHYMDDKYNNEIKCFIDMGFYWFRQYEAGTDNKFCLGTGPYPIKDSHCTGGINIIIPNRFKRATVTSVVNSASFNYDLEPNEGCSNYISDWRCADALSNCSTVARSICTHPRFKGYMFRNCQKYCGHCNADSYGKKFRFVLPTFSHNNGRCWIHVSGLNNIGNVAVGLHASSLKAAKHNDNTKSFSIPRADRIENEARIVLVNADINIQVSVVYTANYDDVKNMINTYPVYPVDTFGTEYIAFGAAHKMKNVVISEEDEFVVVIDDGKTQVFEHTILMNGIKSGLPYDKYILKSEKPFALFCGHSRMSEGGDRRNHFNQILPTGSWGTFYVVPAFSTIAVDRPFNAKLLMQAGTDNTIVTINGDFNAIHPIFYQGDTVEQLISATAVYNVSSNYPIQLGLYLYDPLSIFFKPEVEKLSSFHILPPSSNFLETFNVAVPVGILEELGFTTTGAQMYGVKSDLSTITENTEIHVSDSDVTHKFNPGENSGYGLTVVLDSNNRWMVMSGHSKITTQNETEICTITTSVVGDNVDNDCDGLNDEDTCYTGYGVYSEDMDLDGGFGEDCCCTKTEPSILQKTPNTTCAASTKPDSQCWTRCSCPCSWAAKLKTYTAWSEDEKKQAAQADIDKYQSALKINTDNLTSSTAQKKSADDSRQSAASIGYVGIAMFCVVFGGIIIMDLASLLRDFRIFLANIGDGYDSLRNWFCRRHN